MIRSLRFPLHASRRTAALALLLGSSAAGLAPASAQELTDLPGADTPLRAGFEEVRRIGEPDVLFTEITAAAFGDDGGLYLTDRHGQGDRLLRIGEDGTVVEVGAPGRGPGEYGLLLHFAPIAGGRVAAFDMFSNGYLLFGPDGGFERSVRMPGPAASGMEAFDNVGRGTRSAREGDALVSVRQVSLDVSQVSGGQVAMSAGSPLIERLDLDGETVGRDAIMRVWRPPPPRPSETNAAGMSLAVSLRMFEPTVRYDVWSDGALVVADSTAYAVKVVRADGVVERVLRRPMAPTRVTRQVRERTKDLAREALERELDTAGPEREMLEQSRPALERSIDEMRFYDEISVIVDVKAGWERSVWVARADPDEPWNEEAEGPVDVLTRDGRYLGTFAAEAGAMPLAIGPGGLAAYVETDAYDTQTLVIRRLPAELR